MVSLSKQANLLITNDFCISKLLIKEGFDIFMRDLNVPVKHVLIFWKKKTRSILIVRILLAQRG